MVELRYKDDRLPRLYQAEGMWQTADGGVCVAGVQISNPKEAAAPNIAHNFTVGLISALALTDRDFLHPVRFDRFNDKYAGRIICSA